MKTCRFCGQSFARRYESVYCSAECFGKSHRHPRSDRVTLVCRTCGTSFVRPWWKKHQKFCSVSCRVPANKGIYLNPIKSKWRRERDSWKLKSWAERVRRRDDYTCQLCGRRQVGQMHADHIKPYVFHPDLALDLSNGRTLCVECHRKTKTYGVGVFTVS
jgi:hypothetical protein